MAAPMSVYGHNAQGHIICLPIAHTSGGAVVETITIPAGSPALDLSRAHPIISMWFLSVEGDTPVASVVFLPSAEMKRGVAPDTAGEWDIESSTTFKIHNANSDTNGVVFVTYWAAGAKQL